MPLNTDRNRCGRLGEVNGFIARSLCRVGWCEFSARVSTYFDRRCSTEAGHLAGHCQVVENA